ncbi:unnamed protein product (macronuclear) [Paramecium tetraurelia]|uniref:Chromosome undetermined scaffold_1, whole genome shotgun sequence n=1 Tax=Paramecium tetraurelia TaxID=5888 RepID=Q6BFV2_PARTE|nr:hypothetical protein [Paramecium tetraurelia strain d4-2]XP_001423201.1 uncharacterized protein GSPATT00000238001 [Paramecium tetraurelia]CAH03468.1 hypothetical protein, coiled-coil domain [Paramecium tetraurelia]CAK55803.1 unnamed protein product [Paramecium tetraurelia]|eukprot:XP_001423201.1 hypothetical protein (macronuclear) [Paramecium tetraurelia strain d4-2]
MNKENEAINLPELTCKAHTNKKAKYKVIGVPFAKPKFNLTDLICSKCAIVLISQGYKIEDIQSDQTSIRQEQIQQFLETISQTFLIIDQNGQQLNEKKYDLVRFCEKQKDKVNEHYHQMVIALDNKLKEQIDYLNELQLKAVEIFDQKQQEIKDNHNELVQMYSDIEVNLDNIIMQIECLPYKQIMGQYNKRVQDIQLQLQKLESSHVHLGRVYKKVNENKVLGGLFDDCELEIKIVQTALLKNDQQQTQSTQRATSPQSIQITYSTTQTPDKQRSNSQPSKFLEILNKVNENQLKTNNYYTQLLKRDQSFDLNEKYCSPTFKK